MTRPGDGPVRKPWLSPAALWSRGRAGRARKVVLLAAAVALAIPSGLGLLLLIARLIAPDPRILLANVPAEALEVTDVHGMRLRLIPGADGVRHRAVDPDAVSPHLLQAVLAAEDRRFFHHLGVDPISLARALGQNLRHRRVVSGGSTLTMQLARLLDPRPRGLRDKIAQALLALRLEMALTKKEILAAYLARAPMGNRVVGYEAASLVYFGKSCARLSPAEAALLAGIPRSPSAANPWRGAETLSARRDGILKRMRRLGSIDDIALKAALSEPVVLAEGPFGYPAPHFLDRLETELRETGLARETGGARVVSTLHPALQDRVERIVHRHLEDLSRHNVSHMAVAVLDVRRGEWMAIEGSGGYWDRPGGRIDGTRIPRQPGSALKPFTYAAAFDQGFTPATVIPDLPRSFTWEEGTWTPRNYDGLYRGPVRAREALACSLNVPAATLLNAVGPGALLTTLQNGGITTLAREASRYGLGLTLGAGEVRLDEMVLAYAALVRGGEWRGATSWRAIQDARGAVVARPRSVPVSRVCSEEAAIQVVDILSDPEARAATFGAWSVLRLPFPAMVKTGTSEGFRDNWAIGGTREVVVGVWCGNFNRYPMGNISGVSGAGSVWHDVMLAWADLFHRGEDLDVALRGDSLPEGLAPARVCSLSGLRPSRSCPRTVTEIFVRGQAPADVCDWHVPDDQGWVTVAWPPLYRDWAAREGLRSAPSDEDAPAASRHAVDGARRARSIREARHDVDPTRGAPVAILSPADGDAFVLSPDLPARYQTLALRCSVRGRPEDVSWLVDGQRIASPRFPYAASWPLVPGTHVIEVVAGGQRADSVTVTVYGAAAESPETAQPVPG
jgi:penicillin-binding protein 1C